MATDYYARPRRPPGRDPGRDQEGLPAAGPRTAPGREPRPGDPGAVQGDHPGVRGAVGSGEAPDVRPGRGSVRRRAAAPGRRLRRRASPFSDIMDAFFGGGGAPRRGPRCRARRGRNATIRVEMDLDECAVRRPPGSSPSTRPWSARPAPARAPRRAPTRRPATSAAAAARSARCTRSFLGQVMTSRPCPQLRRATAPCIRRPCPECDGDGRVRTRRTMKVRIPAGVENGTHIQLAGEGEVGPGGGPAGDLFLEIVERPHPIFERQGDDLHCTVTIPMVAAALGATLSVETPGRPGRHGHPPRHPVRPGHPAVRPGRHST